MQRLTVDPSRPYGDQGDEVTYGEACQEYFDGNVDFGDDVFSLVREAASMGFRLAAQDAYVAWRLHSSSMYAGWLYGPSVPVLINTQVLILGQP